MSDREDLVFLNLYQIRHRLHQKRSRTPQNIYPKSLCPLGLPTNNTNIAIMSSPSLIPHLHRANFSRYAKRGDREPFQLIHIEVYRTWINMGFLYFWVSKSQKHCFSRNLFFINKTLFSLLAFYYLL